MLYVPSVDARRRRNRAHVLPLFCTAAVQFRRSVRITCVRIEDVSCTALQRMKSRVGRLEEAGVVYFDGRWSLGDMQASTGWGEGTARVGFMRDDVEIRGAGGHQSEEDCVEGGRQFVLCLRIEFYALSSTQ